MDDFSEIRKITSQINSEKTSICKDWVECENISEVFKRTGLSKTKFQKFFAPKVIDYFIDVANDKEKIGNCPIIGVMLTVFHKLNLQIDDIFLICVNLKNRLNDIAVNSSNIQLSHEINYILDRNFEGVIKEYMYIHYPSLPKRKMVVELNNDNFYVDKISAIDLLDMEPIDSYLIDDLNDIEKDFDTIFCVVEELTQELIDEIQKLLSSYVSIINQMVDFKDLYSHIIYFKSLLDEIDIENITYEESKMYNKMINSV